MLQARLAVSADSRLAVVRDAEFQENPLDRREHEVGVAGGSVVVVTMDRALKVTILPPHSGPASCDADRRARRGAGAGRGRVWGGAGVGSGAGPGRPNARIFSRPDHKGTTGRVSLHAMRVQLPDGEGTNHARASGRLPPQGNRHQRRHQVTGPCCVQC